MSERKGGLVIAGVVLLLAAGVAFWLLRGTPQSTAEGTAAASSSAPGPSAAPEPAPSREPSPRERWAAKREQVLKARRLRGGSLPRPEAPEPADRCAEGCWGTLQLQLRLASSVEGCRELLPAEAQGTARFEAVVIAEPGSGAVVDQVRVLDDEIEVAELTECIVESALLSELVDPEQPVADGFVFRYTAGPPGDNARDFLGDHPEVVEAHPELAAILERGPDAPRTDEDATAFARAVSSDEAAMAAFAQWSAEQGVDLSNVRAGD